MKVDKPQLPFDHAALEPHISARTIEFHYERHHLGYYDKLVAANDDMSGGADSIEQLLTAANGRLIEMAAQVWNHSFYWASLSPTEIEISSALSRRLKDEFGSVDAFRREFAQAATGEFGSGWAWVVLSKSDQLQVMSTTDAVNPLSLGFRPLLVLDVWEHAYYLDFQNERGRYVELFLDHLINWEFLEKNLNS